MKVKLGQAVKMFFGNSSLEMIYFEAVANALDASASEINISINIEAYNKPETLEIEISDNGLGFTDDRYKKFSNLFDVEESSHKGLGRLVYLCYFNNISITSYYDKIKKREFNFNDKFREDSSNVSTVEPTSSGTDFKMTGYTLQKVGKTDYLKPKYIKKRILEEFYSRLFHLKSTEDKITINIRTSVDDNESQEILTSSDIPDFQKIELDIAINLIDKFYLYYSINKVELTESSLIAAVSVDNRTVKVDIVAEENIPQGYNMIFLLFSDFFTGKVDASRQNLIISPQDLKNIQQIFRQKVVTLIEGNIPKIKKRNQDTKNKLTNKYPHLSGYFDTENIGYIAKNEILKKAQDKFFKAQKDLLDANTLTDEQFKESIEISARALTEYILFRQMTIEKLKSTTKNDSEAELHKLFATMRKEGKFDKNNAINDLYRNNAWLLDDKYMTYETILSDRELGELITYITNDEEKNEDRPDLALVFSNNPNNNQPFDVVIVEFKKRGISEEENLKVINQLEKRARKLMKYYNNQIQRIWYYGIIEFNEEIELALSGEYTELYSTGKMYYNEKIIAISLNPRKILPIGIFIWDLDAVINDANSRNTAFLNLIKSKFIEN